MAYLAEIGAPERAQAYYRRWSLLWGNRAAIHAEDSTASQRIKALWANLCNGAYRDQWSGGFGHKSVVKDGMSVLNIRLS